MLEKKDLSFLHDAELRAVSIARKEQVVVLEFIRADGSTYQITFKGVVGFRGVDLIQQNVVSRILLSCNGEMSGEQLSERIYWVNSLGNSDVFISKSGVDEVILDIKSGDLCIFSLEPSWGAEIVVVFCEMDEKIF